MSDIFAVMLLLLGLLGASHHVFARSVSETLGFDNAMIPASTSFMSAAAALATSIAMSNTSSGTTSMMPIDTTSLTSEFDVVQNMCWRWFHQSTVKNGSMYIDGGLQTFLDDGVNRGASSGSTILGYNTYLIKVDLSRTFDWKTQASELALEKTMDPDTHNIPPKVSHGVLFAGKHGDSRIWLYGGTTLWWNTSFPGFEGPTTQIYSLWSFDTVTRRWDQYDVTSESPMRPSNGLAAEAPDLGLAFYFNGQIDSGSSQQTQYLNSQSKLFLEGMVIINTTSQTAVNISTDVVVGNLPRTRGAAVYIPHIGGNGILVLMGGTYKPSTSLDSQEMASFVSMDNITVFDVGAYLRNDSEQLWYSQNATGDIPEPRAHFCTVMASVADGSSHNIYLKSGQGSNNVIFDDLYILSIPSFTWTKVFNGTSPRFGHTCHKVGDQMLNVGGKEYVDPAQQMPCDWKTAGFGILNMSSLEWGSVFRSEEEFGTYVVPSKVQERIKE